MQVSEYGDEAGGRGGGRERPSVLYHNYRSPLVKAREERRERVFSLGSYICIIFFPFRSPTAVSSGRNALNPSRLAKKPLPKPGTNVERLCRKLMGWFEKRVPTRGVLLSAFGRLLFPSIRLAILSLTSSFILLTKR